VRIAFHAAGYVGRRPDRPEALVQGDDACINEDIMRRGHGRNHECPSRNSTRCYMARAGDEGEHRFAKLNDDEGPPDRMRPYG